MKYVLSIDGGGIRGIVPALILDEIEKQTQQPIAESFDLIAGTSTGGILALGLTLPDNDKKAKYSAYELGNIYKEKGETIFPKPSLTSSITSMFRKKYDQEGIETVLEQYFGDARLKESLVPLLVTSYETHTRTPYFFKTRQAQSSESRDFAMKDVARCTSAAPTYFTPHHMKDPYDLSFVDGGVFANNPAMCAYAEAKKLFPEEEIFVFSIGTGELIRPISYEQSKNWGLLKWAVPLLDIVFDGVSDTVDHQLQHILNSPNKTNYIRLQAELNDASDDMDNASPENIERLEKIAKKIIHDNSEVITDFCNQINSTS